jgi:hypothetical protein
MQRITRTDAAGRVYAEIEAITPLTEELSTATEASEARARLHAQRDAMLEAASNPFFEALLSHDPEERHRRYLELGISVTQDEEGNAVVSGGIFSSDESSAPRTASRGKDRRRCCRTAR